MNMHYDRRHQNLNRGLCIRAAEHLGTMHIDIRKLKITPQYKRPPWTSTDHQKHDFELYEDPTINGY
jgi:hypothetical protein